MLVETINICEMEPFLLPCFNLVLPSRTLVVLNTYVDSQENPLGQMYEVKPNNFLTDQCLNMVIIPSIHISPKQTDITVPFVLVNLCIEPIPLNKQGVLGFLDKLI